MATLLDVDPKTISDYDWQGRTGTRYRRCLRTALGQVPTAEDFKAVEAWLRKDVVPWDHDSRHLQMPCMRGIEPTNRATNGGPD